MRVYSVEAGFKGFVAQSAVLLLRGELRVPGQNWQRRVKEVSDKAVKARVEQPE